MWFFFVFKVKGDFFHETTDFMFPRRPGCESWGSSAWRREGSKET